MTRRLLAAVALTVALGPAVPASADPMCDLEHCIAPDLCDHVNCSPPLVPCVKLGYTVICP